MKCQICKEEQAEWAWQPFGPNEMPDSYTVVGSHYRGFPVIKVGCTCKQAFQTGDFEVKFEYQGHHFIGRDHKVKEIHVSLWDGGTASFESCRGSGVMIMKDTIGDSELIAIVADPAFVTTFIAAPRLIEACEELDALRDKITFYLERGLEAGRVAEDSYRAIMLALAKIHGELGQAEMATVSN